jgi:hypothetical protein
MSSPPSPDEDGDGRDKPTMTNTILFMRFAWEANIISPWLVQPAAAPKALWRGARCEARSRCIRTASSECNVIDS